MRGWLTAGLAQTLVLENEFNFRKKIICGARCEALGFVHCPGTLYGNNSLTPYGIKRSL
jgi:hypothetical protein